MRSRKQGGGEAGSFYLMGEPITSTHPAKRSLCSLQGKYFLFGLSWSSEQEMRFWPSPPPRLPVFSIAHRDRKPPQQLLQFGPHFGSQICGIVRSCEAAAQSADSRSRRARRRKWADWLNAVRLEPLSPRVERARRVGARSLDACEPNARVTSTFQTRVIIALGFSCKFRSDCLSSAQ